MQEVRVGHDGEVADADALPRSADLCARASPAPAQRNGRQVEAIADAVVPYRLDDDADLGP